MINSKASLGLGQPERYRIKIRGELDLAWSDWLEADRIIIEQGFTIIIGVFTDQVSLHSMLDKLRDLGVVLVSVCQMSTSSTD